MDTFIQQIDSLFAASAGNLVYHLVLAFSIAGGFQASFIYWQRDKKPQKLQTVTAYAALLAVQLLSFFIEELPIPESAGVSLILPVIDRALSVIGLILVLWIWPIQGATRKINGLMIGFAIINLIMMAGTGVASLQRSGQPGLWSVPLEVVWQGFTLLVILIWGWVFVTRRPPATSFGFAFFGLVFIGHFVQLLFPTQSSSGLPGIAHGAELFAYLLLLALPYRFAASKPGTTLAHPPGQERRRFSADPKTIHAFLNLALETDPAKACFAMTRAVSQAMLADLCILLSETENKALITIEGGYDLIREKELEGHTLEKDRLPQVSSAIDQSRCVRLPANFTTSVDMKTFTHLFFLNNPGNVLAAPLLGPGQVVLGGFVLLSPYSNRLWSSDDQSYLVRIAEDISPLYLRFHQTGQTENGSLTLQTDLAQASQTIAQLEGTIATLEQEKEQIENGFEQENSFVQENNHIENELRLSLSEVARLQNALAEANMQILQMEKDSQSKLSNIELDDTPVEKLTSEKLDSSIL